MYNKSNNELSNEEYVTVYKAAGYDRVTKARSNEKSLFVLSILFKGATVIPMLPCGTL